MSALVKALPKLPSLQKTLQLIRPLILQIICAGISLLAAFAPMFGNLRPLAISFAAAVPSPYALIVSASAAVGYALSLSMDTAVPYLITIVALGSVRAIFLTLKRSTSQLPMFAFAASAFYMVIGMGMSVASAQDITNTLLIFAESLLIFGLSVFLKKGLITPWRNVSAQSAEARASLLFVLMALLICLGPYGIYGVKLIHIAAAAATLFAAMTSREHGGALVAIAAGIALTAASSASLYVGFGIAVAGIATGFFLQDSKLLSCLIFCLAGFMGVPLAENLSAGLFFMAELLIAAIIIMIIPSRMFVGINFGKQNGLGRATITTLNGRLNMVANALANVGNTLTAVCERMPHNVQTYSDVCDTVTNAVCKNCSNCSSCWSEKSSDVYDAFNNMQPILQSRGYVTPADLTQPLLTTCKLPKRLTSALSTMYRTSVQNRVSHNANKAMRAALTEQYNAMADSISDMASGVYMEEMPDKRKEKRIEKLFIQLGAEPLEINVSTDTHGCLNASVQIVRMAFTTEELEMLTGEVSLICRCKFNTARCENVYAATRLVFVQQTLFVPKFGVCSIAAKENISADAYKTFTDLKGCAHALLCDGMGTGKYAAVDGNLAAGLSEKLMMAGFAASEAARLVNVAMSLKGETDSGATLDAITVNLYTGKAKFFKAGAVASFLVRQGVVTVLEGDSLPIGILGNVTGRSTNIRLEQGDTVVLVSDGALAMGKSRICAMLAAAGNVHPNTMAKRIAQDAMARSKRADDITAICLHLDKNKS